jgi:hypothetical protein
MTVTTPKPDKMRVTGASGSMPRRQPLWENEALTAFLFKDNRTGGVGKSDDGVDYVKLGGGIHRWRVAIQENGRWDNNVPAADHAVYIPDASFDPLSARPAKYKEMLKADTDQGQANDALISISFARGGLHEHPSSCSQRSRREEAFSELYEILGRPTYVGWTKAQVDAKYRELDDYVFPELDYEASKTCCWNSTTDKMADIIHDFATQEKAANDAAGVCKEPTPFKASGGGKYQVWKDFAASEGKASDWLEWKEDEPCDQRNVAEDTVLPSAPTMCSQ